MNIRQRSTAAKAALPSALPDAHGAAPADTTRNKIGTALTGTVLRGLFKVFCPTTIVGRDLLPKTSFVICANHSSHCDGPALAFASGLELRQVVVFAATDYFFTRSSLADRLSLPFRLIPVDRSNVRKGMDDLHAGGQRALQDGCRALVIFPTGTRTEPGQTLPFRRGAAVLAAQLGLPLVPAHIKGTDYVLPRGRRMPRRGPVRISFGAPVMPPAAGVSIGQWSRHAIMDVEARVLEMAKESP